MKYEVRRRAKQLVQKFTTSPVLPALGWTKFVETLVTSSHHLPHWLAYSLLATLLWVTGSVIWETLEDAAEAAEETVEDVTDD